MYVCGISKIWEIYQHYSDSIEMIGLNEKKYLKKSKKLDGVLFESTLQHTCQREKKK